MQLNTYINICSSTSFSSFGDIHKNGIVGSYGNSVFNCLRNPSTALHVLKSYVLCMEGIVLCHLAVHCFFFLFSVVLVCF